MGTPSSQSSKYRPIVGSPSCLEELWALTSGSRWFCFKVEREKMRWNDCNRRALTSAMGKERSNGASIQPREDQSMGQDQNQKPGQQQQGGQQQGGGQQGGGQQKPGQQQQGGQQNQPGQQNR